MKIDYQNILKKNMINVLRDVLRNIEENGLKEGHHLYITLLTNHPKNICLLKTDPQSCLSCLYIVKKSAFFVKIHGHRGHMGPGPWAQGPGPMAPLRPCIFTKSVLFYKTHRIHLKRIETF